MLKRPTRSPAHAGSPSRSAPSRPQAPGRPRTDSAPLRLPPWPPADALATAFLLAVPVVAGVLAGRSLAELLGRGVPVPRGRDVTGTVRAQAQDMIYWTLRRYGIGDAILGELLERPLPSEDIHALLLLALYRLAAEPEDNHTTVDQAVEAAGHLAGGRFRALVNGVLRNALRRRERLAQALAGNEDAQTWHPAWWRNKLRLAYPDRWQELLVAANLAPPMALRVNRRRAAVAEMAERLAAADCPSTPVGAEGLALARPRPVQDIPGFAEGLVSVQDPGAQRAAHLLELAAGQRILDACAAPGGKAAHILELADVRLLALDVSPERCQRIEQNLERLGLAAAVKAADCRDTARWWDGKPFDRILADVPCSASGVARRHPDSKWLRRPEDIASFARTQGEILRALWPTLARGGKMLYATCSVFPEENTGQIAAFLADPAIQGQAVLLHEETWLPGPDHDGFYYALLHKPL